MRTTTWDGASWIPGQFVLLIWGVDVLQTRLFRANQGAVPSKWANLSLFLLLFIGVATTFADLFLLRTGYYYIFGSDIGRDIHSSRSMYAVVNEVTPVDAVVQ